MKIKNKLKKPFSRKYFLFIIPCALIALGLWANFRYPSDADLYKSISAKSKPVSQRTITQKICNDSFSINGRADTESEKFFTALRNDSWCVPYPYSSNPYIIRFASGNVGSWIDERRSIVIKGGQTLTIPVTVPSGGRLDFSAIYLSKIIGKNRLTVRTAPGNNLSVKELSSYSRDTFNAKQKSVDSSFPEILPASGWEAQSIDLSAYAGRTIKLMIALADQKKGDLVFIGEPVITSDSAPKKYNVIHILFDAMSQKYMDIYNPSSGLTPNFEKAKNEFIIFDRMYSTGTKTRVSVGSFLTSKLPPATGHGYNFNVISDNEKNIFYNSKSITSISRVLSAQGYFTMQTGNCGFTNPILPTAIDYGFDESYEFQKIPYDSAGITYNFMKRIQENKDKPFYLYAHLNTTHKPRITPLSNYIKGYLSMPSHSWRPNVTGATSYADGLFGEMVSFLKREGLWENTIIIVSSDHGTLYEADNYGRNNLLEDFIKIPFLIHVPEALKKQLNISNDRVTAATSMLNLAPTIADLTGTGTVKDFSGKSIRPLMNASNNASQSDKFIFAYDTFGLSLIIDGRYKYTLNEYDSEIEEPYRTRKYYFFGNGPEDAAESLVDLSNDPLEKRNMVSALRNISNESRKAIVTSPQHPHVSVFTVLPHIKKTVKISIKADTKIAYIEIADQNKNDAISLNGSSAEITLSPAGSFRSAAVRTVNEHAKISYSISADGEPVLRKDIVSGEYLLNMSANPGVITYDPLDFSLETIRLYPQKGYNRFKTKPWVHIATMDIRRWQKETMAKSGSGANTNMKEVLKSWGYIQ
jgi:arylsulfatase A-like enzyme